MWWNHRPLQWKRSLSEVEYFITFIEQYEGGTKVNSQTLYVKIMVNAKLPPLLFSKVGGLICVHL